MNVDKDTLYRLYVLEKKPMHQVAKEMNIAVGTVFNYLKEFDYPRREQHKGFKGKKHSQEAKEKMSKAQKGKIVSTETREKMSKAKQTVVGAGHRKKRNDGYIYIYYPSHPNSTKEGYIMEHILVMEKDIGRYLKKDEVVHHKNFIRNDNNINNLQLMTFKEHASYHMKKRWKEKENKKCLTR